MELGLGYIKQDFGKQKPDVQKLGPTKGFSFKGSLIWNPTDLITITGNMRRTVNETTLAGASSALTSTFGLKADYGLFKELLLSAGSNLEIQSFDGIGQVDKLLKIDLGGKYFIGPYFIADAKYTYEERFADDSVPIRLSPIPTTSRVLPIPRVKLGLGRAAISPAMSSAS